MQIYSIALPVVSRTLYDEVLYAHLRDDIDLQAYDKCDTNFSTPSRKGGAKTGHHTHGTQGMADR
jgi:hypothetical protein